MEPLILTALFVWGLMRYAGTELVATARGTEPPRIRERRERAARAHERAMAKMARRTGPTVVEALGQRIANRIAHPRGPRLPGPARRALGEWWADSWDYATERRRRRHERAAAGDLGRQRAARAARQWFADRRGRGIDERPPPVWSDVQVDDVIDAEIVEDPAPPPRPRTQQPGPTSGQDASSRPVPPTPDSDPPQPERREDPAPPDTAGPVAASPETRDQNDTDQPAAPLASVHPIRKELPMTTATPNMTSGETLDPAAAVAFAAGMAELGKRIVNELELSVSTLSQRGVAGEPVALLTKMQDSAQAFVADAEAAKGHFERHVSTQDVVLSDDTLAGTVTGTYVGARS